MRPAVWGWSHAAEVMPASAAGTGPAIRPLAGAARAPGATLSTPSNLSALALVEQRILAATAARARGELAHDIDHPTPGDSEPTGA
jgi:hypothetical protein